MYTEYNFHANPSYLYMKIHYRDYQATIYILTLITIGVSE